jgi:hypothetical protein
VNNDTLHIFDSEKPRLVLSVVAVYGEIINLIQVFLNPVTSCLRGGPSHIEHHLLDTANLHEQCFRLPSEMNLPFSEAVSYLLRTSAYAVGTHFRSSNLGVVMCADVALHIYSADDIMYVRCLDMRTAKVPARPIVFRGTSAL